MFQPASRSGSRSAARLARLGPLARLGRLARHAVILCSCVLLPSGSQAGFPAFTVPSVADASLSMDDVSGNGVASSSPSVQAYRLATGTEIHLDGRLDDAPWFEAVPGYGFRQYDPDRGDPPKEQTVFKVAYDDDALYFGFACYTQNGTAIRQNLSRRDNFVDSDLVAVFLDPYHDQTTGYAFLLNPLGVQQDRFIVSDVDGDFDTDWDTVWDGETSRDDDGWYAEMRIPFSSIRYRPDAPHWGLLVSRYMHDLGEEDAWVTWDREVAGFVSRFGHLEGLRDIPAPRQLELVPYTVTRLTDPSVTGTDEFDNHQNLGLDLKYGVTSALTLNATFQPDFGQVEADPATLNLSPHETFFEEKRPFFIEGRGFFQHPDFNLFYSRRIGTGDENSRIRYAGKLTGKTQDKFSLGALVASTDLTLDGRAHNAFESGERLSRYFVGRVGKEFRGGARRINLMQTFVQNTGRREEFGDRGSREASTTGLDFDLRFKNRKFVTRGSIVGSIVDPERLEDDPDFRPAKRYGTGGNFELRKAGGSVQYGAYGRWRTDQLDLNDLGFLRAPDDVATGGWLNLLYNSDGRTGRLRSGNIRLSADRNWLYAPRAGSDLHTGAPVWAYDAGHPAFLSAHLEGNCQFSNFWNLWAGGNGFPTGTQRFDTRDTAVRQAGGRVAIPGGGPLISEPATYSTWIGGSTDGRKNLSFEGTVNVSNDKAKNMGTGTEVGVNWTQSSSLQHSVQLEYGTRKDDTQHLENYENPGNGIGGVSFVYGRLYQRTIDLTLRSNILFSRRQSLELYAQPFLTVGAFSRARELTRADTYHFAPYAADGFDVQDWDFRYASVNVNAVYRWEYRPGSALYLVWTQSRAGYDERGYFAHPDAFTNDLTGDNLFRQEPANTFLAKVTYWFPL